MKILTTEQTNEVDRLTSQEFGLPSLLLMENAGMNLYWVLSEYFSDLQYQRIAIVCGKGNNGGDGLVLARQLTHRASSPQVYLVGKMTDVSGDARVNLETYLKSGGNIIEITTPQKWRSIREGLHFYDIIVDALLGTGISTPLKGLYSDVVSTINTAQAFVLSVDIPSGMFSNALLGDTQTVQADVTVTFSTPKVAHILNESQEAIGELRIVPIGNPFQLLEKPEHYLNLMTREKICSYLPARETCTHKGHFGHVAIVSGSRGKSGAAALSGIAALRTGSGLVTLYTPSAIQDVTASFQPELMTEGLSCTPTGTFAADAADELVEKLDNKDVAGIGPGVSCEDATVRFVHQVVQRAKTPLVLDADALNAFTGKTKKLKNDHQQPLILTPHPGEFSRLTGLSTEKVLADKVELSRQFAQEFGVWLVLKGFRTLVAEPDGQVFACPLGNPGMATAGMGDVLTGVLTSLVGMYTARGMTQPQQISKAVVLGVYLHSLAGDLAQLKTGPEALTASDVTSHLGKSYQGLSAINSRRER